MCCFACSFINGLKAQGTKTKDAKVLFYGAGSSAVGVANMIATLIQKEGGLSEKEAKEVSLPYTSSHMLHIQQTSACAPERKEMYDLTLHIDHT
jgi:malic enzyme